MRPTTLNASRASGMRSPPVVIGGVGGSGTRLIAQCLQELGYFMGSDLNESNDNLLFTLLFKRIDILSGTERQFRDLLDIFFLGMSGESDLTPAQLSLVNSLALQPRGELTVNWLGERVQTLRDTGKFERSNRPSHGWGWKEPSTHVILDRLLQNIPNMKYIHVARNGLDMAYSENQTQLALWGLSFLGEELELSPKNSLK